MKRFLKALSVSALLLLPGLGIRSLAALVNPPAEPTPPHKIGNEFRSENLYTSPAPEAKGGIHFTSPIPLVEALAIPQSDQTNVYRAKKSNGDRDLTISGLPIAKYDLVLVAKDHIVEGLSLNRGEDSLGSTDLTSIDEIFSRSVPFFNNKKIEAIKGTPGDHGRAVALVQWMRTGSILNQNGDQMTGHAIRTLRIATLADVGPGWQVISTREMLRTDVFPDMVKGYLPVLHMDALTGIRIIESMKDLGALTLPDPPPPSAAPSPQ